MDNLALQIAEAEIFNPIEKFAVDSDSRAEWAIKTIAEEQAETQRYINVCDTMVLEYQQKAQKARERLENKTAYLKQMLQEYFATVPHKATKTQETYKLPSGTLKLKYGGKDFIRDDELLVKWLEQSGQTDKVKTIKKPDWAELKKVVKVTEDNQIITQDGEIVEGVTVVDKENTFIVEVE